MVWGWNLWERKRKNVFLKEELYINIQGALKDQACSSLWCHLYSAMNKWNCLLRSLFLYTETLRLFTAALVVRGLWPKPTSLNFKPFSKHWACLPSSVSHPIGVARNTLSRLYPWSLCWMIKKIKTIKGQTLRWRSVSKSSGSEQRYVPKSCLIFGISNLDKDR